MTLGHDDSTINIVMAIIIIYSTGLMAFSGTVYATFWQHNV